MGVGRGLVASHLGDPPGHAVAKPTPNPAPTPYPHPTPLTLETHGQVVSTVVTPLPSRYCISSSEAPKAGRITWEVGGGRGRVRGRGSG